MDAGAVYSYIPDGPDAHTTVRNQGDFVSDFANFSEGNYHCTRDDTDLRVYFRPDRTDPTRIGVILASGRSWSAAGFNHAYAGAATLGPFTLTIKQGASTVYNQHFPQLGFMSRWIWRSKGYRPIVRNPSTLQSGHYVLKMSTAVAAAFPSGYGPIQEPLQCTQIGGTGVAGSGGIANPSGVNDSCPATNAGQPPYSKVIPNAFGSPGASGGLGVITEQQGKWLLTGDAATWVTIQLCADAMMGSPMIIPNEFGNKWAPWDPVNIQTGQTASDYLNNLFYNINRGPLFNQPGFGVPWDFGGFDHMPNYFYVPYMATGDPYWLEGMQYQAVFNSFQSGGYRGDNVLDITDPTSQRVGPVPNHQNAAFNYVSMRSLAWSARDYANAATATPLSVPEWLLAKSVFTTAMADNATFLASLTTSGFSPARLPMWQRGFMTPDFQGYQNGFMRSYLDWSMAHICNLGFSSYAPIRDYCTNQLISQLNGTDYPNPRDPQPYEWIFGVCSSNEVPAPASAPVTQTDVYNMRLARGLQRTGWGQYQAAYYSYSGSVYALNTAYKCNSWMIQCEAGGFSKVSPGDTVSLTIAWTLSGGGPVTFNDTWSASDIALIGNGTISGTNTAVNNVTYRIMNAINANATCIAKGITATYRPTLGPGIGANYYVVNGDATKSGRFFIVYNSAVIGTVTVTATFTTAGRGHWTLQPNGDFIHNPAEIDAVCHGRDRSYQCMVNGTSAATGTGPHGTGRNIVDGTVQWAFAPETMTNGIVPQFALADMTPAHVGSPPNPTNSVTKIQNGNLLYIQLMYMDSQLSMRAGTTGAAAANIVMTGYMTDWYTIQNGDPLFPGWITIPANLCVDNFG